MREGPQGRTGPVIGRLIYSLIGLSYRFLSINDQGEKKQELAKKSEFPRGIFFTISSTISLYFL